MKHAKKLIITLSLVLLTLLTIASSILCYLFMPLAFEDPRDDAITDDIAKNRMSRWEFYKKLNESDQSCFSISITIATPSEAFEKFNGEDYEKDKEALDQYLEQIVNQFIEKNGLADYPSRINSRNWLPSINKNRYKIAKDFEIDIKSRDVTPHTYLQEKKRIESLIEEGVILSASFVVGSPVNFNTGKASTSSPSSQTFPLSTALEQTRSTQTELKEEKYDYRTKKEAS